jgi:hypothetical protein
LADRLARAGHEVSLVVRDTGTGRALLGDRAHALLEMPVRLAAPAAPPRIESWADVVFSGGYTSAGTIERIISGWLGLIHKGCFDLVVAELAPGAMLAARIAGIPALAVGMGWNLPPPVTPVPAIRFWDPPDISVLRTAEARLLDAINPALGAAGGHPLESLAALIDPARSCLCAFPELDHYLDRGAADYFGAIYQMGQGAAPRWPSGTGRRCFAYLNGRHPVLRSLLAGLADVGCPSVLHLRGGPGDAAGAIPDTAWLSADPLRLDTVLAERPIVICQGLHTISAALAAGSPVLSVPEHLEQTVLANRVVQQGLGLALNPHASPEEASLMLRRLFDEPGFAARAGAFAERYVGYEPGLAVEAVVEECLALSG